jgi:hypothetical protein
MNNLYTTATCCTSEESHTCGQSNSVQSAPTSEHLIFKIVDLVLI